LALGLLPANRVRAIRVATPACSLAPLIHHRPRTGLEGKFSLEYGIAAALIDRPPGLASFSDDAVRRPEAVRLTQAVESVPTADGEGGEDLLAGQVDVEVVLDDGRRFDATLVLPAGAPDRPATDEELRSKLELCAGAEADVLAAVSWESAATYLRARLAA
jgi:2-methylcitrate dehydratase PrpD